ncbi:hypothetical protein Tco_0072021 [Tanacetum coccineum]
MNEHLTILRSLMPRFYVKRPTPLHLTVKEYVTPEKFNFWKEYGESICFRYVASGPLRKMQVTLPEDYSENLIAQNNGTEEFDLDFPEESDWHNLDKHVFIEDMLLRTLNKQVRAFTGHCRPDDNYVAYKKGLGVVCNKEVGFSDDDFVVEFLGEVYPALRWFQKQDGVRGLQKDSKEPASEFNNIYLERPRL